MPEDADGTRSDVPTREEAGSFPGDAGQSLLGRLRRGLSILRSPGVEVEPYDPEDGVLVTFDGLAGHEEIERYWVNAPYAFVSINYNDAENVYLYYVVEPELDEDEFELLEMLFEDVRDPLVYREDLSTEDAEVEELLRTALGDYLDRYGATVGARTAHKLYYYLYRSFRGFGRLDPIMHDPKVEDVSCDGYDLPIFVYHKDYTDIETNLSFERDDLDDFVVRLAQQSGQHISVGEPIAGTTLPDGSRAELALGEEVTPRGSAFTVRKYAEDPFTPIDLIEYGTFNVEQMAYLWLAIEHNKSLIFAGGTASGKTTSMNAVSIFVPPRAKVLTIEDTRELSLYHDNWLSSLTRERLHEGTDISMYELLRSALRHRPEYIIVGEVRGDEAITLFQAMNTGHTTYSTMHADSVQTVINRLENEPINVPRPMVASLDILSVQTLTRLDDERVRRTQTIAEIEGIDQRTGDLDYSMAFEWDGRDDSFRSQGSSVLDEIRDDNGWSQSELLEELRDRRRVLEFLREQGVDDYRRFTAMVNEYYADPGTIVDMIDDSGTTVTAAADD